MSILSQRISTRLALVVGAALAIAAIVVLSFVLREGGVPTPTDGIGDIPTAHLVPEDVALYVGVSTDIDSDAWRDAIDRLGADDPVGQAREGVEDESDFIWEEDIEPFLGGAAVFFISSLDPEGDDGPSGAVIFRVPDASAAEAVILRRRSDGFEERDYRDTAYKVMEEGGVLAVIGDHFVYAAGEPTLHAIVDSRLGDTRALADSDDFRRLRNTLEGDALAFVYIHPASLAPQVREDSQEEGEPALLSLLGFDDLLSRPIGVVVQASDDALRVRAAALGDPGPILSLLRPRESRFAGAVPEETAIFLSTYDVAGLVDDLFGSGAAQQRLRDAVLESADEEGDLARVEDTLSLLDGEVAFAMWHSDEAEDFEFVFLAEVDSEDRARELLGELFAEPIAAGELLLSVDDGVAAVGTSAAAVSTAGATGLAGAERFTATVAALETPLASFAYVDIWGLLTTAMGGIDNIGIDLDGDTFGLIVNLVLDDDRVQVEAALAGDSSD